MIKKAKKILSSEKQTLKKKKKKVKSIEK